MAEGAAPVAEAALRAIESAGEGARIVICAVVYAELFPLEQRAGIDIRNILTSAHVAVDFDIPESVWKSAGRGYTAYCERRQKSGGGQARRILADFIIGAHASHVGALVTRDAAFYKRAFPGLTVVPVLDT